MKIDVIGGSIAGLSAALTLGRGGADVTVYERASFEDVDLGAGLGVDLELTRRVLGHRAPDPATATATRRVVWRDGHEVSEPAALSFTTYAELRRVLRGSLADDRYRGREGLRGIVGTSAGSEVLLSSGQRSRADLLVCADGRHSLSRRLFAGESASEPSFAGYVLLRALVPGERLRRDLRRRLMSDALHIASAGHHHMVAYPVRGDALNWGWYYGVSAGDLVEMLIDRHGEAVQGTLSPGTLSEATLRTLGRGASAWRDWPRDLADDILASGCVALHPVYEYASPRLAYGAACLIGDAAHLASPITGAGARMAMHDALALGDALADAGPTGSAVAALFELRRLAEVQAVVAVGRSRGDMFRVNDVEAERSPQG